jgi:hypothetical protein
MSGCMSTTPTAVLKILLDLPHLQLVVENEARQTEDALPSTSRKNGGKEFPVSLASFDRMILLEVLDLKILKEYPSREALLTSDGLKFYTDGSLFKGKVGSGVFSDKLDLQESFAFGSFASVLQTEFHAILACSDYCLKKMLEKLNLQ